ncbi:PREDICTED: interactor of constitutive active ROPs 2, chloroplastic-like [Nelumbo nucifera]|uniref:Interactor of constitutive active ROPs 2, chloroplastic-like n=2 Tax=Nelumbo nucifera TaxID=4432 RepID=A0A1U8BCI9_NELNU|nr:PREDICTED: interactor of constitutive active ROPs 2, chloroplastic-like [Nelumbo nucifera]DAD41050.1 TPA_asm: hypothetical protein HUJ06_015373 [Nelumbo nucifera]
MQQKMRPSLEEELKKTRERLDDVEEERDRLLDELAEMKKVAEDANLRLCEALSAQNWANKLSEMDKTAFDELEQASIVSAKKRDQAWQLELEAVQKQHAKDVESLLSVRAELSDVQKSLVLALESKNAACKEAEVAKNVAESNAKKVASLTAELNALKDVVAKSSGLGKGKNVEDLLLQLNKAKLVEEELSNAKESEAKMLESLITQTKQFEETKILLEEAKLEVTSLREKIESLENSTVQSGRDIDLSQVCLERAKDDTHSIKEKMDNLKSEVQVAKDCAARAQEKEELSSSKARGLAEEMNRLRTELKLATDAEEKNKEAMDDLALALKEVSTEANVVKGNLSATQAELDAVKEESEKLKEESEKLKLIMKSAKEKYERLLDEKNKEIVRLKETSERLKIEAEEATLAWTGKEIEFVNCIKRADEESNAIKEENSRLAESLQMAENMTKTSKEENSKLRDILKQALNESNVAKEAAEIARAENSQLKDSIDEKEKALQSLMQENEHLRNSEAEALKTIHDLKEQLLSTKPTESKADDKETGLPITKQNSIVKENRDGKENKDGKKLAKVLHLDLEDLRLPTPCKNIEEDPEMAETLKGSIFDTLDSPEPVNNNHHHHHHRRATFSVFADIGEAINSDDFDHLECAHADDDNDRSHRKKKALLRRVGDILRKTSFHRRDTSIS